MIPRSRLRWGFKIMPQPHSVSTSPGHNPDHLKAPVSQHGTFIRGFRQLIPIPDPFAAHTYKTLRHLGMKVLHLPIHYPKSSIPPFHVPRFGFPLSKAVKPHLKRQLFPTPCFLNMPFEKIGYFSSALPLWHLSESVDFLQHILLQLVHLSIVWCCVQNRHELVRVREQGMVPIVDNVDRAWLSWKPCTATASVPTTIINTCDMSINYPSQSLYSTTNEMKTRKRRAR
jgi:hypothetical protein